MVFHWVQLQLLAVKSAGQLKLNEEDIMPDPLVKGKPRTPKVF